VTDPQEYFNGNDFWDVPNEPADPDSGLKQPPFYLLTKLPGQDEQRFQLTAAVTPVNRDNLAAIISGSYVDGRPRLEVLELPDQTAVFGPVQVHQRMTNNSEIRTALNLLSSNQAQVQYGNLLSLPFGNGMLYVEPVYVKSNQENAYPLLQKVLLTYGDGGRYTVLADSIDVGIQQLVEKGEQSPPPPPGEDTETPPGGEGPTPTPTPSTPTTPPSLPDDLAEAADRVEAAIAEVRAAQASGDPARWGRAIVALEEAMRNFENAQRAAGGSPSPAPGGSPSPQPDG
jgi:uncharacterized membrane protein (UPF0182 family)